MSHNSNLRMPFVQPRSAADNIKQFRGHYFDSNSNSLYVNKEVLKRWFPQVANVDAIKLGLVLSLAMCLLYCLGIFFILFYALPNNAQISKSRFQLGWNSLPSGVSNMSIPNNTAGLLFDISGHGFQFILNDQTTNNSTFWLVNDPIKGTVLLRNRVYVANSTYLLTADDAVDSNITVLTPTSTLTSLTDSYTIAYWFLDLNTNISASQPNEYIISSYYADGYKNPLTNITASDSFGVFIDNGLLTDSFGVQVGENLIATDIPTIVPHWSHYTISYNNFQLSAHIYINGTLDTTLNYNSLSHWDPIANPGIQVGGFPINSTGSNLGFYGLLTNLTVWNYDLNEAQVGHLYQIELAAS